MTALRSAAIFYGVGLAIHTADHIRRGSGVLPPAVRTAGAISTILGVIAVVLVLRRHRLAPLIAALVGFQGAIGIARVHLLSSPGSFSDAFPGAVGTGVTAFSWVAVILEIAGALVLGIAAANVLVRHRSAPA